jgi:type II secretory pathway pseudopilin PulG
MMYCRKIKKTHLSFSLIEISIVIAVIAIFTALALNAKSLIRAGNVKAVTKEINNLKFAMSNFKTEYGTYPGDLKNANTLFTITSSNGDGNGIVSATEAKTLAIVQLRAAGYLHKYQPETANLDTVTADMVTKDGYLESNVYPETAIVFWHDNYYQHFNNADVASINLRHIAKDIYATASDWPAVIDSMDAFIIDKKIDDAQAKYGKLVAWHEESSNVMCTSDTTDKPHESAADTKTYLKTETGTSGVPTNCVLTFYLEGERNP